MCVYGVRNLIYTNYDRSMHRGLFDMDFNTVGENIKKYREEHNWRQQDLAEKSGLTANYIGLIERGERIPALESFVDIVNALGVSADMVLADVLEHGYVVKSSQLEKKMRKLSPEKREYIFDIIETFIKKS